MLFELRRGLRFPGAIEAEPSIRREKWVIEPSRMRLLTRIREFWRFRRILWFFVTRSVTRRYQKTRLGWLWLFIRPLAPILISTFIFGRLLGVPSGPVPYFLFFLTGMASWMLFDQSLLWATRSLEMNKRLITQVYFPRLILPVASIAPAVVDFLIYTGLMLCALIYYVARYGEWYLVAGPGLLFALAAAALSVVFAISVGLWTSVWQVQARDVRFTLRYVTQFWLYLTPVIYPLSQVPERWQWLIMLNPMTAMVETFKWGTLGIGQLNWRSLGISVSLTLATMASGIWYFGRAEASSIDKM